MKDVSAAALLEVNNANEQLKRNHEEEMHERWEQLRSEQEATRLLRLQIAALRGTVG